MFYELTIAFFHDIQLYKTFSDIILFYWIHLFYYQYKSVFM